MANLTPCSVPGCQRVPKALRRGMCNTHYQWARERGFSESPQHPIRRLARHKDFTGALAAEAVAGPNGCLLWAGSLNQSGYGVFRTRYVHRLAWEMVHGPVPDGLELDHHKCFNRNCVNVEHLEPVTPAENKRRMREQHPEWGKQWGKHGNHVRWGKKDPACPICS